MRKNRKRRELWQFIDRKKFDQLVAKWDVDKWVRDFKTWEFTCALITILGRGAPVPVAEGAS